MWLLSPTEIVLAAVGGLSWGDGRRPSGRAASCPGRPALVRPNPSVFLWGSYNLVVIFGASWIVEPIAESRLGAAAAARFIAANAFGRALLIILQALTLAAAAPLAAQGEVAQRR